MGFAIGIRELKSNLSAILRRVKNGEAITVTYRKRPVALLLPFREAATDKLVLHLVEAGRLAWSGGKPSGSRKPPTVRGPSVGDAVIEDRR